MIGNMSDADTSNGVPGQDARTVANLVARLGHCAYGDAYRDGLKPAQWSALRYFSQANRFSRTMSAFAAYQGTSAAAASQTISTLVGKKLLERTADTRDRRKHHVTLTARARRLIASDPLEALTEAAATLAEPDRRRVVSALHRMLGRLLEDRAGVGFGYCADCRFLACRRAGKAAAHHCELLDEVLDADDVDGLCVNFVGNAPT